MKKMLAYLLGLSLLLMACTPDAAPGESEDHSGPVPEVSPTPAEEDPLQGRARDLERAVRDAYRRCVDDNDPSQAVAIVNQLLIGRQDPEISKVLDLDELTDLAMDCATFELSLESVADYEMHALEVAGRALLVPVDVSNASSVFYAAQAPLFYISASSELENECVDLVEGRDGIMTVLMTLDLTAPATAEKIELQYTTGPPTEHWLATCDDAPFEFDTDVWNSLHCLTHQFADPADVDINIDCSGDGSTEYAVEVEGWDVLAPGPVFAERRYDGLAERSAVFLMHSPQR